MFKMSWKCVKDGHELEDIRKDRKTIKYIEKYGIFESALYYDGKYLPLSMIEKIQVKPSVYFPNHCCGKGIPVFKIGIEYGVDKPAVLMVEQDKNVQKMISIICIVNSNIVIDWEK